MSQFFFDYPQVNISKILEKRKLRKRILITNKEINYMEKITNIDFSGLLIIKISRHRHRNIMDYN